MDDPSSVANQLHCVEGACGALYESSDCRNNEHYFALDDRKTLADKWLILGRLAAIKVWWRDDCPRTKVQ